MIAVQLRMMRKRGLEGVEEGLSLAEDCGFYSESGERIFERGTHNRWVRVDTCPMLDSDDSLIYKHPKSIDDLAPFGTGIFNQVG